MHHKLFLVGFLLCLAALSGHAQESASQAPAPIIDKSLPEQPGNVQLESRPLEAVPAIRPAPAVGAAPPPTPPRLALLLPLKSRSYVRAAEAVRDGFIAAAEQRPAEERLPIWEYPVDDTPQNLISTYARAVADGARVIVGPLTREGVAALIKHGDIAVPTLALNSLESSQPIGSSPLYMFGLSLEAEARQVATLARQAGKCSAAIIYADTALWRRVQSAFAEEWNKSQCVVLVEQALPTELSPTALKALRTQLAQQPVDVAFIAGDAETIKRSRSYLKTSLPVYATSQAYRGPLGPGDRRELRGVFFVDMPWLLQPDHPAVAIYPQPKKALSNDLLRFYAQGIDAYRLTQQLLTDGEPLRTPLDGVTGRLTRVGNVLVREALGAAYQDDGNAGLLPAP